MVCSAELVCSAADAGVGGTTARLNVHAGNDFRRSKRAAERLALAAARLRGSHVVRQPHLAVLDHALQLLHASLQLVLEGWDVFVVLRGHK